ncbi:MAG: shikimate dehydrogenase family protein, partial [Eubacteriaceae bacterium]
MLNKSNEQKISGHTRLYAVIGNPVRHSLSPALQTAAFRETGIDAVMLAFEADTDNLEQVVESLKTLDSPGWNVTMPCKGRMAELCDELTREAQLTGSVNTVVNRDGKLIGHSTDGIGLMRHLQASGIDIRNRKIVIAGAGGAAASIAAAASGIASEVVIANRTTRKAEELA